MKKLLFFAAMMFGLASCQTEPEGLDVTVGGEQLVNITVGLPEATRAASGSGFDLNSLEGSNYELRYILEIYVNGDSTECIRKEAFTTATEAVVFPVRLVPERNYRVVAWADIVPAVANRTAEDYDYYYETSNGLDQVTIIEDANNNIEWNAMDEYRDAYTAFKVVNNFNANTAIDLELKRPFAKLRVVSTDIKDIEDLGFELKNGTVNYTVDLNRTYNALYGTSSNKGAKVHEFTYPTPYAGDAYETETRCTLFADYIFVDNIEEQDAVQFTLSVYEQNDGLLKTTTFNTDIALHANTLTTIIGEVLTEGGNVQIEINGELNEVEKYTVVSSASHLLNIINAGGDFMLGNHIIVTADDVNEAQGIITRAAASEPKTTTINLNGYTITLEADVEVKEDTTLIIDNQPLNETGGDKGAIVSNGGQIVNNGNLNIEGGHFGADTIDNNNGEVNITGGTFESNPSSDFVDDDYIVVEGEDGKYTIELKPEDLIAFERAIAQGGDVTLTKDITLLETVVIEAGNAVNLNLNGNTITGNWHKSNGAVIMNNGTLTIVGGTISSTGENGGSAIQNNGGTLTVENATLNGAPNANGSWPSYSVNNTGVMTLKNTKITSYHGAVASYDDGAVVTLNNCVIDMAGIPSFTSHGIYTYNSGKVVVNGGIYENKATDQASSGASVINGAVEVSAGTFSGRIENYYGTPVLKGGTFSVKPNDKFIATGYKAVEVKGEYMVVAEDVSVVYGDAVTAATLGKNKNATVYVMPNEDGSEIQLGGKLSIAEGVTLIGMGETPVKLFNDWGSDAFANQAHFTNTYIENIHFTNNLIIDASIANGDVKFVNCVFGGDRAHQGVHFDSGNGTITFENCTFIGRNMFGSSLENVVFNNCTFLNKKSSLTGADKWTGVNMWGKYEFNNCTFDTEAHCNVKCDGVVAVFNNCECDDNRDITAIIQNTPGYNAEITFNE